MRDGATSSIRQRIEEREAQYLHPKGTRSTASKGRAREEEKDPVRTDFMRDRDRIIHSKALRRLKGKTQVFWPSGDHFRTRMTHTLEVCQIARTLARGLRLNEDLTEAIALGHDLGHPPFGHAGEEVLEKLVPGGFHHAKQSLRVVDVIENDGKGLNLCHETRDGILFHTKGIGPIAFNEGGGVPETLEGEVVRFSDVIAYVNHDIDDTIRASILDPSQMPRHIFDILGETHSKRIGTLVKGVLLATDLDRDDHISMEETCFGAMEELRMFLFERVYLNSEVRKELGKARGMIEFLWEYFVSDLERFRKIVGGHLPVSWDEGVQAVTDFIAGMTDAFAIQLYEQLFIPRRWFVIEQE